MISTGSISRLTRALCALCATSLIVHSQHGGHGGEDAAQRQALPQDALEPFVDAMPIPPVAQPVGVHNGYPLYDVEMRQVEQQMHRDLPPTPVFAYNGIWPGPTFDIPSNQPIYVQWRNELPMNYPYWLPVSISGHVPNTLVRTVVHLHGGVNPSLSDGFPDWTWISGESALYHYPNIDAHGDGAMNWYHDHAMGTTRINVYAGLSGFYFLRNQQMEASLNLPSGDFEVPLVIQDRNVDKHGVLIYEGVCRNFGVVNGRIWPYFEVEPRRYRFRILQANNFRVIRLELSNGAPMHLIGVDDGLLDETVTVSELLLAPAERADVIIDFSDYAGEDIVLNNTVPCGGPYGEDPGPVDLHYFMQFRVLETTTGADSSSIPTHPGQQPGEWMGMTDSPALERDITLDAKPNFRFLLENLPFHAAPTTTPRLGTSELWNLVNLSSESHPIHIHEISFRIIERVPFREGGVDAYIRDRDAGTLQPLDSYLDTAAAIPAPATEWGPKDVAYAATGYVTRVAMDWYGFPGNFVFHCHILDHEDNDMMRPLILLGPDFAATESPARGWMQSPWFGLYYEGNYSTFAPWIYHEYHHYLYVVADNTVEESPAFWLYDTRLGWLWTRQDTYPFLYSTGRATWLYYLPDSTEPRWIYDFGEQLWNYSYAN